MKNILAIIFLFVTGASFAQVPNRSHILDSCSTPNSVITGTIPYGMELLCPKDSTLKIYKGVASGWDTFFDSAKTVQNQIERLTNYLSIPGAIAAYQPLGTYATASNTVTFTNKSGNISQWTNDVNYLTVVPAQSFASLTGKPTTLSGYGITDGYPLTGNPSNFLITINSSQVTTALGYTPINPNGTTLQYFRGDGSKATFPTAVSSFSNDVGYITGSAITGKLNTVDSTGNTGYAQLWRLNKVRDSLQTNINTVTSSLSNYTPTTRTISTTSPLQGGGDMSANRTFSILNSAADNVTKGAASFDSSYFSATAGNIFFTVKTGTGTISSNAVTLNQPRGKITYNSPNLIAAGTASLTLTNSYITTGSTINVGINGNGSTLTSVNCYVKSQANGSAVINIQNLSLLSLFNTNMVIDYFVVN